MVSRAEEKIDAEVASITHDWVGITKKDDPLAFAAWASYRRSVLGCHFEPKEGFTVPSEMPPTTLAAAKQYAKAVKEIRDALGWRNTRAKLPENIIPWAG